MVYYIDPQNGSDSNAGITPEAPWCTITGRVFEPGDQVLFRRGSVIRKALRLPGGSREGVITYGAYGDGPDPVVNSSVNAGKKKNCGRRKGLESGALRDPFPAKCVTLFSMTAHPSEICDGRRRS